MTDNCLLREELQVLESIYPDYILESTPDTIRLEVPIELDAPRPVLSITKLGSDALSGASASDTSTDQVLYLPPIIINIRLPDGYPAESPPIITSIHATHSWLPNETQLAVLLLETWKQGEGVLCDWVELVRSGAFLERVHLIDEGGAIR